jgi:hypothetical protein
MRLLEDIHVWDTPVIRFTVKDAGVIVDLTSASVLELDMKKPDGTAMTRTLVLENAVGGVVYYAFLSDEIDQAGHWRGQPYIEMAGWKGHAEEVIWYVKPVLPSQGT